MKTELISAQELIEKRKNFFREMDKEFPPVIEFIATNSGVVELMPKTQEQWDNYHENLQFVDGAGK